MSEPAIRLVHSNRELPVSVRASGDGPTYTVSASGGGGGGDHVISIAKLETRLVGAFGWLSLLTVAAGVAFLFLINGMSDIRKDVGSVQSGIAAQTATTTAIQSSVNRIADKLDKINDQPNPVRASKNR